MAVTTDGIRSRRPGIAEDDVLRELHRILGHRELAR